MPSPGAILLSLVVAFIPALGYTLLVWWLDRYEREPFRLLVIAFFWGAVPAIALAILLEYRLGDPFAALETVLLREFGMDSLAVPVIEELTKGLALLLLFLLVRNKFDNVLDGIVYGAVSRLEALSTWLRPSRASCALPLKASSPEAPTQAARPSTASVRLSK